MRFWQIGYFFTYPGSDQIQHLRSAVNKADQTGRHIAHSRSAALCARGFLDLFLKIRIPKVGFIVDMVCGQSLNRAEVCMMTIVELKK